MIKAYKFGKMYLVKNDKGTYLLGVLEAVEVGMGESSYEALIFRVSENTCISILISSIAKGKATVKEAPSRSELQKKLVQTENISDKLLDCLLSLSPESRTAIYECLEGDKDSDD